MEHKHLFFKTPKGVTFRVAPNGNMTQSRGFVGFSGNWKFLGLVHVKRNEFIALRKLTSAFLEDFDPCWKNGNPQWTVVDRDHGTVRIWGNTKYNGVARIWRTSGLSKFSWPVLL